MPKCRQLQEAVWTFCDTCTSSQNQEERTSAHPQQVSSGICPTSVTNLVFHSHASPSTQTCSKLDKKFKMTTQKGEKYIQLHNHIPLLLFLNLPCCNIRNGQEIGAKNAGRDSTRHRLNVSESGPAHL